MINRVRRALTRRLPGRAKASSDRTPKRHQLPLPQRQVTALERAARRVRNGRATGNERRAMDALVTAYLLSGRQEEPPAYPPSVTSEVAAAFGALWQPRRQPVPEPSAEITSVISDQFHRLYYHVSARTWKDTWYRGVATYKCPTDMWVYQELVHDLRPGLVIETGTFRGGSALFLADRLDDVGHGRVVTIDIDVQPDRPEHPRLTYLTGSSVDVDIVDQVRSLVDPAAPVLVILDSDHSESHVAAELRTYGPLVTPGSYLIVEDTNVNGHPAAPEHGPGPWEATQAFLAEEPGFEVDPRCERYFLTQNPQGFLRKMEPGR